MRGYSAGIAFMALLTLPGAALAQPNLQLNKSGPTSAVAGTALTYTFTIVNNGSSNAADVELDDILPAGITLLGDSLDACGVIATAANHQQTVNCELPDIPASDSLVLRMNVLVEHDFLPDRGMGATNTATVTTTGEANAADNTDAAPSLVVSASADLTVQTFAPANPVPAGEIFTYSIVVDNLGPSAAEHVIIMDTLAASANVQVQSCAFSVSLSDGSAIELFNCTTGTVVAGQFVINIGQFGSTVLNPRGSPCDWDASAPAGEEEDCTLSFGTKDPGRIRASFRLVALQELTVESTTTVASETPDPDPSNNETTESVDVEAVADLEVQKVAGAAALAGEVASWEVTVINHGPSAAQNALLLDTLPAGLVDGSVAITGNVVSAVLGTPVVQAPVSCSLGTPGDPDDPAQCDLGSLPAGWGAILTVSGLVHPNYVAVHDGIAPPIGLTNDVEVSSDTPDVVFNPNPDPCPLGPCPPAPDEPNFASATVMVSDSADLALQKFAVGTPVAGGTLHYELQIRNLGPSVSRDVTLRDYLPAGVQFLSAAVDLEGAAGFNPLPCTVPIGSNDLFCPLGNVPLTGTVPIFVFVSVAIDAAVPDGTVLTNTADVSLTDTADPVAPNNSDDVAVVVSNPAPDLFTEVFGAGEVDLEGWQVEATPEASPNAYTACITGVTALDAIFEPFPQFLTLDDDDFAEIVFSNGKKVALYGVKFDRVYVGSNGYVTFGTGDIAYSPDAAVHFDLPRVSGLFADLDPTQDNATVAWAQMADRVVIAWNEVHGYNDADINTFAIELYFDGRIRWKFQELDGLASIVGLSKGLGLPAPFFESDFAPGAADYPLCPEIFRDGFETGSTSRWL